ncbi:phage tail protein [Actinomadura atramentaria]|uniref:phage tail protein n=1 Tax=Actinomadura atramentaria TaxID=1990 RepID=UPI0003A68E8F|nr:phage tail protein [Actinomadura atramentaria]
MPITQKASIAHIETDPLRNFRFRVKIHKAGFPEMGFMAVSGLNITTEVIPYREGGMNTTTQKMPGQADFAPITLSKGLAVGDSAMMEWTRELFTVLQGTGPGKPGAEFRARVQIDIIDHPVTVKQAPIKASFMVYNAWPTAVAFSDLDAGANAVLVQQMTLAHEGFEFRIANKVGTAEPKKW